MDRYYVSYKFKYFCGKDNINSSILEFNRLFTIENLDYVKEKIKDDLFERFEITVDREDIMILGWGKLSNG